MPDLQNNSCFNEIFKKVDRHAGGKWLIQGTKHHKDNQFNNLELPSRVS